MNGRNFQTFIAFCLITLCPISQDVFTKSHNWTKLQALGFLELGKSQLEAADFWY